VLARPTHRDVSDSHGWVTGEQAIAELDRNKALEQFSHMPAFWVVVGRRS
jgi:hypothetical protein